MKKVLILFLMITALFSSAKFQDLDLGIDNEVFMQKGSYKVLRFDNRISKIKIKDNTNIDVSFNKENSAPLQSIKIFAKEVGRTSLFITFDNGLNFQLNCFVTKDMSTISALAKSIASNLIVEQTKGKIILKGSTPNQKVKDQVLDMFEKAGIILKTDLIDLAVLENPDKMVKVKLYVVEIDNTKGLDLKNNWFASSKNYMQVVDSDGLYYNTSLKDANSANAQRSSSVHNAIDGLMTNAVSLTGGLTGAANYLGKYFNVGVTLNYLSSTGVANILDETTLITLENKESVFLAGGTVYVKVQTTTAEGLPSTDIKEIDYGLQLDIKVKNIVGDKFVNLEIVTKSTDVDFTNTVDGIPSFKEKSIETNVIAGNGSTIVLGGLISRNDAESVNKIPLLGDIPILGALFTSKSFQEGKSELVFFITPEIVDPKTNTQVNQFNNITKFRSKVDNKFVEEDKKREERLLKEAEEKSKKNAKKDLEKKSSLTVQSQPKSVSTKSSHEQRMKALGY